ncbi:MAG TPA: FtsX-like permease family protein [Myxococcaceae bacterium]|nr:FtsX-like permease family protein [Myxococcaceae bacterium]
MLWLVRLISIRHLLLSPLRSALTVGGVAVGVATLVAVTVINRSVMQAFRSTVDTVSGRADLTVAGSESGFDESVLEAVKKVPGVTHASAALTAVAPVAGSPGESLYVLGVDFLDDGYFRDYRGAGQELGNLADDLELLNSTDRMLVSERFARDHGLKPGSTFRLVTADGEQPFVVHAVIKEEGPIKAFGGWVGVMFLGSAQEAFHRGRAVSRIDVAVDGAQDFEEVRARIQRDAGPQFEVDRPSRRGGTVEKMVLSFQMGLNLGSGVALMVGVFLVYNTVAIGVVQRRREIGIVRALGASAVQVRALFTLEAIVMGTLGASIGLPFAIAISRSAIGLVSRTISQIYVQVHAGDVRAGTVEIALGAVLGIAGSAVAALRPAIAASRVQPVEALRRDIAAGADAGLKRSPVALGVASLLLSYPASLLPEPTENFPLGGYVSVFLVLASATLLMPWMLRRLHRFYARPAEAALGISGRLAADNFARAPGRSAVPSSALMIGVGMTVCIAGFVGSFQQSSADWIDQAVPADLFITSSAKLGGVQNVPMRPELAEEMKKLPGVWAVDRVRLYPTDALGLRVVILSLTPEIHDTRGTMYVLEGALPTPEQRRDGWVSVSENLSRRRGLHPGGTFPMPTPTGLRTYKVAAVVREYTSDQGTIFVDREEFVRQFQDERVDTFEIYLDDPRDAQVMEAIRKEVTARWGRQYHLFVLSNRELRAEAHNVIDGAFSVTYAMEGVAVLLALLGVVNTLLAAVLDRTREIGLLRAVGASRRHVLRLFAGEAGLIGLTGGLVGVVSGIITGFIIVKVIGVQSTGWSFPYRFPWATALQMVSAASVCAVLAGLYPADRAASLDVVEALAYE